MNTLRKLLWPTYTRTKLYDKATDNIPYDQLIKQNAAIVVKGLKRGTYLDLGCGTGNQAIQLALNAGPDARVIGIDKSPEALEIAQKKYERMKREYVLANISFIEGDIAQPLPFSDSQFEGITANNSIYLVDPFSPIIEALRVMKSGSLFLMSNPRDRETSSSLAIVVDHISQKKEEFNNHYGKVLGDIALSGHILNRGPDYFLILPFEFALRYNLFNVDSRFWPVERWINEIEKARKLSPYQFTMRPPFESYSNQNHTIVIEK